MPRLREPRDWPDVLQDVKDDLDATLADILLEEDLVALSPDYRDGYERGFREATFGWVMLTMKQLKTKREH